MDVGTFRVWGTYRALPTIYDLPEFRELVREFTDSIRTTPDMVRRAKAALDAYLANTKAPIIGTGYGFRPCQVTNDMEAV